jgi:long-chain acyl-CoA synthetase
MGKDVSYGETDKQSKAFAAYLQGLGLAKGDRVAMMMPNCPQYPIAVAAILRAGLILVNVNPLYTPRELEHQLKDSGAKAIIIMENFGTTLQQCIAATPIKHIVLASMGDRLGGLKGALVNYVVRNVKKLVPHFSLPGAVRFNEALDKGASARRKPVAIGPDDVAVLQYTGGTTGVSKGAVLLHRNVIANVLQSEAWNEPGHGQGAGRRAAHQRLRAAAVSHLRVHGRHDAEHAHGRQADPDPESARHRGRAEGAVEAHHPQLPGRQHAVQRAGEPPRLQHRQLEEPEDLGRRRHGRAGRGGQALARKTGCPICEGYGLSETSPSTTCNPTDSTAYTGTIGLPLPNTWLKLLDDEGNEVPVGERGEIAIKGPQVMAGYWQRPDETAKVMTPDGYFKSGDIGVVDERGYFKVVDRKKDMILVSGFNVYPNEIEDVVALIPGVLECAAVGVPDEKTGEGVKLVIVKKDPSLTEAQGARVLPSKPYGLQAAANRRVSYRHAEDTGGQDPSARTARREEVAAE